MKKRKTLLVTLSLTCLRFILFNPDGDNPTFPHHFPHTWGPLVDWLGQALTHPGRHCHVAAEGGQHLGGQVLRSTETQLERVLQADWLVDLQPTTATAAAGGVAQERGLAGQLRRQLASGRCISGQRPPNPRANDH